MYTLDSVKKELKKCANSLEKTIAYFAIAEKIMSENRQLAWQIIEEGYNYSQTSADAKYRGAISYAHFLFRYGRLEEALHLLYEILPVVKANRDKFALVLCLENLGIFHWQRGLFTEAIGYFEEEHVNAKEINDITRMGLATRGMGLCYLNLNEIDKAEYYFKEAISHFEREEKKDLAAFCYNWLGVLEDRRGNLEKALEMQLTSYDMYKSYSDSKGMGDALNSIGLLNFRLQNYDTALNMFNEALIHKKGTADLQGLADIYNNIGMIFFQKNESEKSLEYYEKSLKFRGDVQKDKRANTISNMGKAYSMLGQYEKALELQREALQIRLEYHYEIALPGTYYHLGTTYRKMGDWDNSILNFNKALEHLQNDTNNNLKMEIYLFLGDIYQQLGNEKNAMEAYAQYINLQKQNTQEELKRKLAEANAKYELDKKEKEAEIYRLKNVELVELNNRLDSALKAKDQFLANISHEIRTPLNAILGFSELLEARNLDRQEKTYVNSITLSSRILLKLINDILDLSRIEAGKMDFQYKPVNIYGVLKEIETLFSYNCAAKGINFILNVEEQWKSLCLSLDEVRLRQILLNLVGNAVKFTEKGNVTLELLLTMRSEISCELTINVQDTGIGIPKEQQELVFESFQRQKGLDANKYQGSGLGLAITKRLVEMLQGKISLESEPGMGSCFSVHLSNVTLTSCELLELEEDFEEPDFLGAKIIIADDLHTNRLLLKNFLGFNNLFILEASSGQEAYELALKHHPTLIMTDLYMDNGNGENLASRLKSNELTQAIPIWAISAYEPQEKELFQRCFTKPVFRKDLLDNLCDVLPFKTRTNHTEKVLAKALEHQIIHAANLDKDILEKTIVTLQKDFYPRWEKISKMFILSHIQAFAHDLILLAQNNSLPFLTIWSQKLSSQIELFDMENLPKTLSEFPKLIGQLQDIAKNSF